MSKPLSILRLFSYIYIFLFLQVRKLVKNSLFRRQYFRTTKNLGNTKKNDRFYNGRSMWWEWLVPRYTTTKIFKNFVPAIFVIFLIVYSRIRHALTLWRIQPPHPTKIKTPPFGGIFISGGSQ